MIRIKAKDLVSIVDIVEKCRETISKINDKYPEWDTELNVKADELIVEVKIEKNGSTKGS